MRTSRREQTERARDEGCDCYLRCATGLPRPEIDHYGLPGPRLRLQTAAPEQRGVAFVLGWLGVGVLGSGCPLSDERGGERTVGLDAGPVGQGNRPRAASVTSGPG